MSQDPRIITLSAPVRLPDWSSAISEAMGSHGFCIFRGLPNDGEAIHAMAQHFGDIQRHIRDDGRGVVGDASADLSWQKYLAEYHGVSKEEFLPHTDGSFVDGMLVEDATAKRVTPPRLLLVQIARRAERGGENTVADGGRILEYLAQDEPEIAHVLLRPGCITISRDDQMALDVAVFERARNGRLKLRFRYDETVYAPAWARDAVERFHRLTLDPRFNKEIDTEQGDILVFDNWRVLHGRKSFSDDPGRGQRKFRRVWISDDDSVGLFNVVDNAHLNRSQEPYQPYVTIPSPIRADQRISFPCGVALSSQLAAILS